MDLCACTANKYNVKILSQAVKSTLAIFSTVAVISSRVLYWTSIPNSGLECTWHSELESLGYLQSF